MDIGELFIQATRERWRFQSRRGQLTVEDLWKLSLTELDTIAKALHKSLSEQTFSLINDISKANQLLEKKFELIKYIVLTKKAELDEAKAAKERAQRREMIAKVLAKKELGDLEKMSTNELKKLYQELS